MKLGQKLEISVLRSRFLSIIIYSAINDSTDDPG